jgi:hypothetical protein
MRRFLTTIISLIFATALFAQGSHLKFKGVPIDGSLTEFVNKMKTAGFTHIGTEDGIAALKGDFAGHKNCSIAVCTVKPLNIVSMIAVMFENKYNWSDLESDYNLLKELLTEKYGAPTKVTEEFESTYIDDNRKLSELSMDRGTWASLFETESGDIELYINSEGYESTRVVLRYRDKINTEKVRKQALEDL